MTASLYHKLNSRLGIEFDRYVLEHPEFSARIPKNAQVVLQLEGETGFNRWARGLARRQRERGQPVVLVKVRGLRRMPSRLIEPLVMKAA